MKLLLYSHYFAPSIGGVETIVMSLARGVAALRQADGKPEFELTLVTQTAAGNFDDGGLPFSVVRQPGFRKLLRLVREAEVLHIAGPALAPVILGLMARKPVVVEHHGFQVICPTGQMFVEARCEPCPGHFMAGRYIECWNCDPTLGWFGSRKLWLLTFVRRFLSKRVAANIMPTSWLGEQLGLPRATTIHHGLVRITSEWKRQRQEPRMPVMVFQGRLVSTKGAHVLLDAAKILCGQGQDFELVFIGDGPERAKLEMMARQPPPIGRVRFTGKLTSSELETELARASIVVAPSLGGEVFGLVVAENMLRGIPVIASDLGSFLEVLGEAAVTFRCGNPHELASRIRYFLEEPNAAMEIARQVQHRAAERFALEQMVNRHAGILRSVRAGRASALLK